MAIDVFNLAAPTIVNSWDQMVEYSGTPYFLNVAHLGDHAAVFSDQMFWLYTDAWGIPHFGRDTAVINLDLAGDGTMSLAGYRRATGVAMAALGPTAFVVCDEGLHILAVSDSAPPELESTLPEFDEGGIVAVAGNRVLVPRPGRIDVLDTSYPGFVPALVTYDGTSVASHFLLQSSVHVDGNWVEWSCAVQDLSTPGSLATVYSTSGGNVNDYRSFSILAAWPGRVIVQGFSGEGWGTNTTYADTRSGTPVIFQFGAGSEIRDAQMIGDHLFLELESGRASRDASQPETLPEIATFDAA